jgi:predicted amidohydrolase YtcJ
MDGHGTVVAAGSAVLVERGRVAEFLDESVRPNESCRRISFGDRPLMPAFLDIHAHLGMTTLATTLTVDCHTPPRLTIDEIVEEMQRGLALADERGGWLIGQGSLFQDQKLRDKRFPTRHDLDRVSTRIPVALRCGGHVTVLNTKALEVADIERLKLPPSGRLDRDRSGRLTGIVREVFEHLPIPALTAEQRRRGLRSVAEDVFTKNGITYVGEISQKKEDVDCIAELVLSGEIQCNVDVFTWVPATATLDEAVAAGMQSQGGGVFRARGVKVFSDGGFSASTAAVKRPYRMSNNNLGDLTIGREAMGEVLRRCRTAGLQLVVHANGERAQDSTCQAVLDVVGREADPFLRTRIEHAGNFVSTPETVELWGKAGVACVAQPGFLYTFGDFFPDYLGDYARAGRFPFRTLRDHGLRVASSSDVSGSELRHANPFFNAWCLTERRGFRGEVIDESEAITVDEALEMQTCDAAEAAGVANERGSLEPGKAGDLVVLDRDPRHLAGEDLLNVHVDYVVRNGQIIYARPGAAPASETDGIPQHR